MAHINVNRREGFLIRQDNQGHGKGTGHRMEGTVMTVKVWQEYERTNSALFLSLFKRIPAGDISFFCLVHALFPALSLWCHSAGTEWTCMNKALKIVQGLAGLRGF